MLETTRYTVEDARKNREPASYVQSIVVNGRNAGIATTDYAQVLLAYEHLDSELRLTLTEPTPQTTVAKFIEQLNSKKHAWFEIYGRNRGHTVMHGRERERDNRGPRAEGNRNGQYGSFRSNFPSQAQYQSPYQSPYRQSPFPTSDRLGQTAYQGFSSFVPRPEPFNQNQQSSSFVPRSTSFVPNQQSNTYQQRPTGTTMVPPQVSNNNQRQPLQPTQGNANPNPNQYRGPYQNRAGPPYNQQNGSGFRPNYPQQPRVYYGETADRYNQFEDYKNDYYNNGRFEQEDGWANYAINEDRAFQEAYEEAPETSENVDANHTIVQASYHCRRCPELFNSNNALHKHVRSSHNPGTTKEARNSTSELAYSTDPNEKLVRSNATNVSAKGYGFRGWRYATVQARLFQDGQVNSMCLDTGCTASLIDRGFLKEHAPNMEIKKMASPMKVRGLGSSSHSAEDYVDLDIYFPTNHGKTAVIHREIHIVDDLKANILIGTDILVPERIDVLLSQRKAIIGSCENVELDINVTTLPNQTNRLLMLNSQTTIPAYGSTIVQIRPLHGLPTDRDLLFEPDCRLADAYTSIVDHQLSSIELRNSSDKAVVIPRHTRLGRIVEYEADGCFLANPDLLRAGSKPTNWIKSSFRTLLAATAAYHISSGPTSEPEQRLQNGVTVYGDTPTTVTALTEVTNRYPRLWEDNGNIANVPEDKWMEIPLLDNWKELYKPGQAKVYPLGTKDRKVVDEAFNKLHEQGRMVWTTQSTPFTYPCFVVWKTTPNGRKGRVVVDI